MTYIHQYTGTCCINRTHDPHPDYILSKVHRGQRSHVYRMSTVRSHDPHPVSHDKEVTCVYRYMYRMSRVRSHDPHPVCHTQRAWDMEVT